MRHHSPIIPYVSLCSGYEGIGLGLRRCIPNLRAVAYCEREAFAIANLVAKMENGLLDSAPVFADVRTFPWSSFTRLMAGGILSFGWPCQPVSVAGQRKAVDDERWLFDIIADGIAIMQPGMLFAENVEGLLTARMPDGSSVFGHCIERLESLHYRVTAGIFSASEVGAPHQRKRIFILANRIGAGWEGFTGSMDVCGGGSESGGSVGQKGLRGRVWPSRPDEHRFAWEPPRVIDISPECSMGRDIDGSSGRLDYAELSVAGDNRTDELRLLGNGVVPTTAELAYRTLMRELVENHG
jgi:site-specific DNA-cytosine methylase